MINEEIAKNDMIENLKKNDQLHFDISLATYNAIVYNARSKNRAFSIPREYLDIIKAWEGFSFTLNGMRYKGFIVEVE